MNDLQYIRCLPEHLDARSLAPYRALGADRLDEERIYVPFAWYRVQGRTPTPFGHRTFVLDCLVNALSAEAATSDPFVVKEARVAGARLLKPRCREVDAGVAARRRVTHHLGRIFRTLANFRVTLDPQGLVYQAHWLVRSADGEVLVDGTTGAWFPLPQAT